MKMKYIIGLALLTLISCTSKVQSDFDTEPLHKNGVFHLKVIDSCEYIEYDAGYGNASVYSLTHKGNCKNCKNCRK